MAGNRKTSYDDDINRVHSTENDENLEINDNPDEVSLLNNLLQ